MHKYALWAVYLFSCMLGMSIVKRVQVPSKP